MRKLIITDTQYNRITNFRLIETRFDVMAKKTIKPGDIIRISYKNTVNNFKVLRNDNGQIIMDNIDAGSTNINYRYFMTLTSLHGNDLTIRRVHKKKEPKKLSDLKSWAKIDVRDITNVEVIRNGSVIDTVDAPAPSDEKTSKLTKGTESEDFKLKVSDNIFDMTKLTRGQGLSFELMDGSVINFCVEANQSYKITLGLYDKSSIEELNNWDSFGFTIEYSGGEQEEPEDLYEKNQRLIFTPDGGKTMTFKLTAFSGDRTKDILIKNIKDIVINPTCDGVEPEASGEKEEPVDAEFKSKLDSIKQRGKEVYDAILNDPHLRKAFYHQPTLFGAIRVGDPVGIIPAEKILRNFFGKKTKEKLGENFDNFQFGNIVTFEVLNKMVIPDVKELNAGETLRMKVINDEFGVAGKRLESIEEGDADKFYVIVEETAKSGKNTFISILKINDLKKSEKGMIRVLKYK